MLAIVTRGGSWAGTDATMTATARAAARTTLRMNMAALRIGGRRGIARGCVRARGCGEGPAAQLPGTSRFNSSNQLRTMTYWLALANRSPLSHTAMVLPSGERAHIEPYGA